MFIFAEKSVVNNCCYILRSVKHHQTFGSALNCFAYPQVFNGAINSKSHKFKDSKSFDD